MIEAWRNPYFNRAAVLLYGGLIAALCVGLSVWVTLSEGPVGLLLVLPAVLASSFIFWAEALTAEVRRTLLRG